MSYYMGIDPGTKGGICILDAKGQIETMSVMPTVKGKRTPTARKTTTLFDPYGLYDLLDEMMDAYPVSEVVIERLGGISGAGKSSGQTMHMNLGKIQAYFHMRKIEFLNPLGIQWQPVVWEDDDIVWDKLPEGKKKGKKNTKASSLNAAFRIWPSEDFLYGDNESHLEARKGSSRTVSHDGLVDAALIAKFGMLCDHDDREKYITFPFTAEGSGPKLGTLMP